MVAQEQLHKSSEACQEPFRSQMRLWRGLIFLLVAGYALFLCYTIPTSTEHYHEARESRMGMLEKVRRGKRGGERGVEIVQNRFDVDRVLVKTTPDGENYRSQIVAKDATLTLQVKKAGYTLQEEFHDATCTLQEDLYYLLPTSSERIYKRQGSFFQGGKQLSDLHKNLLSPFQAVRVIQSTKLLWDMQDDFLKGFQVNFYDYQLPGHGFPEQGIKAEPIVVGYSDSVTIHLEDGVEKRMDFEGVHLQKRKVAESGSS